ncbi:MAG: hypothetical protein QOD07_1212, partial [Frankiaceae bacterium]|nr:hypothetical protein [Frankiaceae bacterium]
MTVQLSAPAGFPAGFRRAVASLSSVELRPEIVLNELPAPQRLAPYAVALSATVTRAGEELADGRLVVLHDPDGQSVWEGDMRCVAYLQAPIDVEIASDPMLPSVGWSWLHDALTLAGAEHRAAGGTVTRTTSERFGALADHPPAADVEIASDPMLPSVGWSWLLEALAGAGAEHRAAGGTVTRTTSERFGAL